MKKFLLGLLLAAAVVAAARADEIKVELIVFENLDPSAIQAEIWPANPGAPALDNAIELAAAGKTSSAAVTGNSPTSEKFWRLLLPTELSMGGVMQRLRNSPRYRPLLHVGWVQPLDGSDRSPAVHVFSGMAGSGDTPVSSPQINGVAAVRRNRFMHGDVDLLFKKNAAAAPITARLDASRRLRNNEVHYLDHPLFGVIIKVTPIKEATNSRGSGQ